MAGDDISLSSVLSRKRNPHILGSGQGAISTAEMFSVCPDIVAAFAARRLHVQVREVPLADIEDCWAAKLPSGESLVFVVQRERELGLPPFGFQQLAIG